MDKIYEHKNVENKIYEEWEEKGLFKPEINPDGEPYSIILPPPNANAPLHFGHAMYVIEDILIRYHRMKGDKTLWLPGADHAGFETQFVFEKHLQKEGKSRFDYDRDTLYKMIWDFVQNNRGGMESQLRRLGFSLDWTRLKFTLDPDIVKIVHATFKKLYDDGLVYRAKRLVNYCTFDGTSFSDLEVVSEEGVGKIYEIIYPIKGGGEIIVATTRPETLFGDAAVMVYPEDPRYKNMVGKTALLPLVDKEIPIIADESVEKEFGTGAVKVTPLHDFNDWDVSKKHDLTGVQIIGFDGKMQNTSFVDGLFPKQARSKALELLRDKGLLKGEKEHKMVKKVCYKCKNVLEPLPLEQWFVKMEPLAKKGLDAVRTGKIKIHPKSFEKIYFQFLENIRDWNISRQVVWGIRIPGWRCEKCLKWMVTIGETPEKCLKCNAKEIVQDEDTFDTWFSSAQWPFATLMASHVSTDYETFYPTTVMETGYDILRWWVARMIMVGIYETEKVPFKNVVLHGLVNDPLGKKMSKSKGNVINPMELVEEYGADAVRFALVYGTTLGNDQALSYPKLEAMRRFSNKLWNMARFIEMKKIKDGSTASRARFTIYESFKQLEEEAKDKSDKEWVKKVEGLSKEVTKYLESYQFNYAAEKLYDFVWHEFADKYIEDVKNRIDESSSTVLSSLFLIQLKLLHPFMPFITEEINKQLGLEEEMLIISFWSE